MLTSILPGIADTKNTINDTPGVVYAFGASFEHAGNTWHSAGPMLYQWLGMYMAHDNNSLVAHGHPGEYWTQNYAPYIDSVLQRRIATGSTDLIDACVIGLTGQAFFDYDSVMINLAVEYVAKLKTIGATVIVLEYPPIEGRYLPYLTEFAGVDEQWWDRIFRPAYRAAMVNAGAVLVNAHYDWQPNNEVFPNTAPYPDYHITSWSAKRAAKRIYNFLMTNTSLRSR